MKRLTSLLLVLCMAASLSGCRKTLDEAAYVYVEKAPAAHTQEKEIETEEKNVTEAKDETPSQSQPETEAEEVKTEPESEKKQEQQPEIPLTEADTLTVDSLFSEHEVIVVTKANSNYELSDFPEADAFHIVGHNGYFTENYHPEYMSKRVYSLLLNEPSKQNALETAKKLMDNPNVEFAAPSCDIISEKGFYAVLDFYEQENEYTDEDFPSLDVTVRNYVCKEYIATNLGDRAVFMSANEGTLEATYEQMKLALEDEKIIGIIPIYKYIDIDDEVVIRISAENNRDNYSIEDFPYLDGEILNVEHYYDTEDGIYREGAKLNFVEVFIRVNTPGKRTLLNIAELVEKDTFADKCNLYYGEYDEVKDSWEYSEPRGTISFM